MLSIAGALVLAAAVVAPIFIVSRLEQRMTFHPGRYDTARPQRVPASATDLTITTSDGVKLDGWFFTGAEPRNGTTVLFLHGNSGTLNQVTNDSTFLQSRGFDVFAIDYRGYGKSEGQSIGEDTLKLDGEAALRYLTEQRHVDPATIAFFGQSLGTTVAANLAVGSPCRAAVLMAPLASARAQAHDVLPQIPSIFYVYIRSALDVAGKIERARCPVMVVHGDRDTVIAVAQGRAVYEAARPPKKLIIVPGGAHVPLLSRGDFYVDDVLSSLASPPR